MKFDDFKPKALELFTRLGELTSRQLAESVFPGMTVADVNPWLKKMVDSGIIARKKDESFVSGLRYIYYLPVQSEVISEEMSLEQTWQFVIKEMPSFASSMFRTNTKPHKLGKECLIEVCKDELMKVVSPLKHALQKAMSVVCGGKPSDYQVTLITPAIDFSNSTKSVWDEVLLNLSPFLRPLFSANLEPVEIGKVSTFRVVNFNVAIGEQLCKRRSLLIDAITNVLGGNSDNYRVEYLMGDEAEESNQTAPLTYSIPDEIKSEFSVKPDGSTTVTLRGAARLLGISQPGLTKAFGNNLKRSGLAQDLIGYGFQVITFGSQGIPDKAFGIIANYYAHEAGRYCTDQAKAVSKAFVGIGIREWIHHELGWQPHNAEIARKDDKALTENLSALVVSVQGLVTSAQSQQAMIHDQQAALKDVFAGLNQLGMTMQNFGQKISYHDDRIVELSAYIEKLETERQNFKKTVLGVNPIVQAPPKGPRNELIQLVGKFVYLKGLGKDGYGSVWADLYRDIELRCGVMLEVERKKLVANGQKDARKIDAIESLGLMEIAVSIAQEMLRAA